HAIWNEEFRIWGPAVVLLGQPDFFFAQRLAVCGTGVLLVRRAVADMTVHDDQSRAIVCHLKGGERPSQHLEVVSVTDTKDIPSVGDEPGCDIVAERQVGMSFYRDSIVVIDPAEVRNLKVSGERSGLLGDSFHKAAVAGNGVYVIVDHVE